MYNDNNLINTPGGMVVNFIPSRAITIESGTSNFQPGILYCGVGGDIAVVPSGQTASVLFQGIPSGAFLPVYIKGISAYSSCSNMLICY
jgi:hypothetical protein